jgi:hypothetical protein
VKKLTASRLAEACRFAIQPQVVAAAAELGAKLARENGARDAAKVIAGVV